MCNNALDQISHMGCTWIGSVSIFVMDMKNWETISTTNLEVLDFIVDGTFYRRNHKPDFRNWLISSVEYTVENSVHCIYFLAIKI